MKNASHVRRRNRNTDGTLKRAAAIIRRKFRQRPRLGVILGSGFEGLRKSIRASAELPYSTLRGLAAPTVAGHAGSVILGRLGGAPVVVLGGRVHDYEGHDMQAVTAGVRLLEQHAELYGHC